MRDIYSYKDNFEKYSDVKTNLIKKGDVTNPLISIFIPTYKRNETLEETLQSALNQRTNVPYEVIVVSNDPEATTNKTKDIIEKFCSNKIYYYVNTANIGLCGNWNRGIELARSDYISMIHDDDILSPYFIESVLKAITDCKKPGVIGVDYYNFNSANKPCFVYPDKVKYRQISKLGFFFGRYINIAGMTVRKDLIKSLGGYADEYYPNEDTIFIYQALLQENVINICNPLAGYRQEMNASLSVSVMEQIIILTELTRRNIAEHESFAQLWMFFFDKEFFYEYINNSNKYWNLNIDFKQIFKKMDLNPNGVNRIKLYLMDFLIKIVRKGFVE